MTTPRFNKNRPHGSIFGASSKYPGAKFSQGGHYFDGAGNCLSSGTPDAAHAPVPAAAKPKIPDVPDSPISDEEAEVAREHEELKDLVVKAEEGFAKADANMKENQNSNTKRQRTIWQNKLAEAKENLEAFELAMTMGGK